MSRSTERRTILPGRRIPFNQPGEAPPQDEAPTGRGQHTIVQLNRQHARTPQQKTARAHPDQHHQAAHPVGEDGLERSAQTGAASRQQIAPTHIPGHDTRGKHIQIHAGKIVGDKGFQRLSKPERTGQQTPPIGTQRLSQHIAAEGQTNIVKAGRAQLSDEMGHIYGGDQNEQQPQTQADFEPARGQKM